MPALLGAVLLAACTSPSPTPSPTPSPSPTAGLSAQGWVTSGDGSKLLADLPVRVTAGAADASNSDASNSAASNSASAADITVDTGADNGTGYQTMDGFGAGLTHSSAEVLMQMPEDRRKELMTELFDPTGPVRIALLRIPIGASDFVPSEAFSLDDVPSGEQDWDLQHFSTAPDQNLQPLLRQALELNPNLKIIASPWSPPAWLKTSDSLEGGALIDDQRAYDAYAEYFVRFVQDYRDAGIDIWALTVQNEPQLRHPDGYPGTDMPVSQEATLIETLGPKLAAAGLAAGIMGFDHNWQLNPADAAATPEGQDPAYQYPADLLRTPAAEWLIGTAFHCYYGSAAVQSDLHDAFPDKGIWVTECSGSHSEGDSQERIFADTLDWQSTNLLIPATRNWANGVQTFNLTLDPDGGPHAGGCDTCTPVVTVHPDGTVTRNAEYYLLAQAGQFVQPGAVRLGSDTGGDSPIAQVAFRNPDGSLALIAYNTADAATKVTIAADTTRLTTTLPAKSLATLVWGGR